MTGRDVILYVHGFARGDARMARAILDCLTADRRGLRRVAKRYAIPESTLRRWRLLVKSGMGQVRSDEVREVREVTK